MNALLKMLGATTRTEIKNGKLWEITRLFGRDISTVEQKPVEPEPFKAPPKAELTSIYQRPGDNISQGQ